MLTWMALECVIIKDINQAQKDKCCGVTQSSQIRRVGCQGRGVLDNGAVFNGDRISAWEDDDTGNLDGDDDHVSVLSATEVYLYQWLKL